MRTLTLLAALRHDRIDAPCVLDGPINGLSSTAWVEPTLKPGDVVIMDNLSSHKGTRMPQVAIMMAAMRRPTILELHQHLTTFSRWPFWRRLLPLVPRGMLAVATLTDDLAEQLDPVLERRVAAVHTIASAAPDFGHIQIQPQYDVGYVGSFMSGKGIERVYELAKSLPDIRFVIYGDPTSGPNYFSKLGALPNVMLGGFIAQKDIAQALNSFRIGIAPYSATGFGARGAATVSMDSMSSLKIVEYMSASRAILSSRIPSVEAVLVDGHSGLLCDPDDLLAWRAATLRLVADAELAAAVGTNARRHFLGRYSYAARAREFARLAARLDV